MNAKNVLVQTQRAYSIYSTDSQTQEIELLRYIDAEYFASGALEVRLHSKGSWPTTTTVTVKLENVSPAPDDPATLFVEDSSRASVTFTQSHTAPALEVSALSAPISGHLRCVMTVTSTADGRVDLTIGINVVGRNG